MLPIERRVIAGQQQASSHPKTTNPGLARATLIFDYNITTQICYSHSKSSNDLAFRCQKSLRYSISFRGNYLILTNAVCRDQSSTSGGLERC